LAHQLDEDPVHEPPAARGEDHEDHATVAFIALTTNESRLLQLVQPLGDRSRSYQAPTLHLTRGQTVWPAGATERRQRIERGGVRAESGQRFASGAVEETSEAPDPRDDSDRAAVDVRALAPPRLLDRVDIVVCHGM
jgi:hypothetical protein